MAITFRSCLDWLSNIIGDYFASTTTTNGNIAKTTFIDTSLARFPDDWLKNWWITLGEKKGFISPTSHNDPDSEWNREEQAYDGFDYSSATNWILAGQWGKPIEFLFNTFKCFKVQINTTDTHADIDQIVVQIYRDDEMLVSYTGTKPWETEVPLYVPAFANKVKVRFHNGGTGYVMAAINEIEAQGIIGLELRQIKAWHQADCVGEVYVPAPERILSGLGYSLHRFSPDDKQRCINEVLYDVYPSLYERVQEEITGLGTSYNEYDMPAAFAESYPQQAYIKKTVNNIVSYERLFDISYHRVNGQAKLYAVIDTDETLVLIGDKPLNPFTSLDSSLDISDKCARAICLKAAINLYRMQTSIINAEDAGRFETLATRWEAQYDKLIEEVSMPSLLDRVRADWSWLKGGDNA